MDKDEASKILAEEYHRLEDLKDKILVARTSWRESEKAMTLANVEKRRQALNFAYHSMTGKNIEEPK